MNLKDTGLQSNEFTTMPYQIVATMMSRDSWMSWVPPDVALTEPNRQRTYYKTLKEKVVTFGLENTLSFSHIFRESHGVQYSINESYFRVQKF